MKFRNVSKYAFCHLAENSMKQSTFMFMQVNMKLEPVSLAWYKHWKQMETSLYLSLKCISFSLFSHVVSHLFKTQVLKQTHFLYKTEQDLLFTTVV